MLLLLTCTATVYSVLFFCLTGRRDGLLLSLGSWSLVLIVSVATGSCAGSQLYVAPTGQIRPADSVLVAAPWLSPVPDGLTQRQAAAWTQAQIKALGTSTAPAGKTKIKNAGNVQQKVTTGGAPAWLLLVAGLAGCAVTWRFVRGRWL